MSQGKLFNADDVGLEITNLNKSKKMMNKLFGILTVLMVSLPLPAQTIAPVEVTKVRFGTIAEVVDAHGAIQPLPKDDAKLSAISLLRIDAIYVKPGDMVQKGQRVIRLQRDLSPDMALQKAKIALKQAQINVNRARKLFENGVIARVKLEQAETQFHLAKADFELQQRSLDYAIENSVLRSPISGVVSSVNGVVGQVAEPSQVLAHIVNLRRVIANVGVETEDFKKIHIGQRAKVVIPNLSDGHQFIGKVIKRNREIDPSSQLIYIWIELDNPLQLLQPGMYAVAHIFVREKTHALIVPRTAVLKGQEGSFVFIVDKKFARKIMIKPGIMTAEKVQILDGLRVGQLVVSLGNYELEDGMRVEIKKKN